MKVKVLETSEHTCGTFLKSWYGSKSKWDFLRDLVPLVQFKKHEKHSKCFSRFLNCTNGTKHPT